MFKKCDLCGGKTVAMHQAADGSVCHKCFLAAGFNIGDGIADKTLSELGTETTAVEVDTAVRCAKCGSTSVTANKKGFGAGKAAAGVLLTGGLIGLAAGNMGAKKVRVTCLKCGHQWDAGKK